MKISVKSLLIATLILILCTCVSCVKANAAGIEPDYTTCEHEMSEWVVTTAPTCSKGGWESRYCTKCNSYWQGRTLRALGHTFDAVVTEPTCVEEGYTTYTCQTCGMICRGNTVAPTGHTMSEWNVISEVTCTEAGYKTRECTNPGCTYHEGYCEMRNGHRYSAAITQPTCEEEGYTTYTCTYCGDTHVGNYKEPTGHYYEAAVVAPTCEEPGYIVYTCQGCDKVRKSETESALGHSFTDWEVVKAETCLEDGVMQRHCTNCSQIETESVKATGHAYVPYKVTKTAGSISATYICKHCGEQKMTYTVIQKVPTMKQPIQVMPVIAVREDFTFGKSVIPRIAACQL